jgi:site-specific DNA recombinase
MVKPFPSNYSAKNVGTIYVRYSTKFQHSIEDQIRACQDWAEKNGIFVPDNLIFIDRAVTGKSSRRQGLKDFKNALDTNQAQVAIALTTNRLYRKSYQALQFVEEEIVDKGKRAVFVKSGIDTNDTEHWKKLLHIHAMMDEFVILTTTAHIHCAHAGLLLQGRVFGTLPSGYTGEPIPGQKTRLGKPAQRLIVNSIESEWVKKVFHWFVIEHVTIREIVRLLNAGKAPLPPRAPLKRWTRLMVRRMLSNPRYRGWWEYGRTQSVWLNKPGYSKKVERKAALASIQIDSLRIIDDVLWYAAQERLGMLWQQVGRLPVDGDRQSRPRVLNGLVFCPQPQHESPLYVHGPYGKYMSCKACREAAEPELFSLLPRRLALDLVCTRLADLILVDELFVGQVADAFQNHLQKLTQPDPLQAEGIKREINQLTRQIEFILDTSVETAQDQRENQDRIAKLRSDRVGKQKKLAEIDEAMKNPPELPDSNEIISMLQDIQTALREVPKSDDPAELAALHDLIKDLTGGKIVATQQGEKKPQKGWLRLTFHVSVLDVFAQRCGFPEIHSEPIKIEIDIRHPDWKDEMAEKVKVKYDQNLLKQEIADELDINRNQVTDLLQNWSAKHGQVLPDGRKRRTTLTRKQRRTPTYVEIANKAADLWNNPANLSALEIARQLDTSDTMFWKALAYWHRIRGLPIPTAKDRRERIMLRVRHFYEVEKVEIKQIATMFHYTPRGMKLLIQESYARTGEKMPDGRSHRQAHNKADRTC